MQKTTVTLLVLFLLGSFVNYGQDNEDDKKSISKLKFHSVSFSPLDIYLTNENGGISPKIDVTLNKDLHLFKIQFVYEYEFDIFSSFPEKFYEFNLLYGRELALNSWLFYDVFGGFGYFHATEYTNYLEEHSSTIGFPIQNRLRFQTKGKFGGGLQFQANINSLRMIYSPGFFFQLNF